jgi:hypothetical protein
LGRFEDGGCDAQLFEVVHALRLASCVAGGQNGRQHKRDQAADDDMQLDEGNGRSIATTTSNVCGSGRSVH